MKSKLLHGTREIYNRTLRSALRSWISCCDFCSTEIPPPQPAIKSALLISLSISTVILEMFVFGTDLSTWSRRAKRRRGWRRRDPRSQRHLPQQRRTKLKQVQTNSLIPILSGRVCRGKVLCNRRFIIVLSGFK